VFVFLPPFHVWIGGGYTGKQLPQVMRNSTRSGQRCRRVFRRPHPTTCVTTVTKTGSSTTRLATTSGPLTSRDSVDAGYLHHFEHGERSD